MLHRKFGLVITGSKVVVQWATNWALGGPPKHFGCPRLVSYQIVQPYETPSICILTALGLLDSVGRASFFSFSSCLSCFWKQRFWSQQRTALNSETITVGKWARYVFQEAKLTLFHVFSISDFADQKTPKSQVCCKFITQNSRGVRSICELYACVWLAIDQ
jgi:hypothetical protein